LFLLSPPFFFAGTEQLRWRTIELSLSFEIIFSGSSLAQLPRGFFLRQKQRLCRIEATTSVDLFPEKLRFASSSSFPRIGIRPFCPERRAFSSSLAALHGIPTSDSRLFLICPLPTPKPTGLLFRRGKLFAKFFLGVPPLPIPTAF